MALDACLDRPRLNTRGINDEWFDLMNLDLPFNLNRNIEASIGSQTA